LNALQPFFGYPKGGFNGKLMGDKNALNRWMMQAISVIGYNDGKMVERLLFAQPAIFESDGTPDFW
jgi:hypothetical protein